MINECVGTRASKKMEGNHFPNWHFTIMKDKKKEAKKGLRSRIYKPTKRNRRETRFA